jgi:hypothetical protein
MKRVLCVLEQPAKVEHRPVSGKLGRSPENSYSRQVEAVTDLHGKRLFVSGAFAELVILIPGLSDAAKHQIKQSREQRCGRKRKYPARGDIPHR